MSYTEPTDKHGHEHLPKQDARSGETTGRMRIVLVVSVILAIVALGVVMMTFMHPGTQP
jgi:heme/copper-type cytochrome/quinol oxidase subunit 4